MPERYYCYSCGRYVSATEETDGSYRCNNCNQNFVEIRDEPEVPNQGNINDTNNVRRNPFFSQTSVVTLPGGMVTVYMPYSGNSMNSDGMEQLLSAILANFPRENVHPHTSHEFIQSLERRHPTSEELSSSPVCAVCENDITQDDEILCLPCNHLFHPNCILPWIENHNTCPTCRAELPASPTDYEDGFFHVFCKQLMVHIHLK